MTVAYRSGKTQWVQQPAAAVLVAKVVMQPQVQVVKVV
jgi:hypothetical protein